MKYIIIGVLGAAALAYIKWRLTPPAEALGSYLPDYESQWRQRLMIKYAQQQVDPVYLD